MTEPNATTAAPPALKVYLLCVGRRGTADGKKLANGCYLLTKEQAEARYAEDVDGTRDLLSYKTLKFSPGTIVEVEAKDTQANSIFTGTARIVGRWEDEDDVVRWKSYDTAWAADIDAKKAVKKNQGENALYAALDPVRAAYRRLPNVQRAQLLARVVAYLVK